ncbi:MAG: Na(+)-translocating NADH-quinone reductase subunit [Bacteroidetes bacterium]|nr:Na(+)-translocating NADH-quinone reductase subunit [Bacteroidota bacterium]
MQKTIKTKKGLDIRLIGEAAQHVQTYQTSHYAITPDHFKWLTPKLLVQENEPVLVGQPLFFAKENNQITITSPVSGKIAQIIRGEKRKIEHITIESDQLFQTVDTSGKINDGNAEEIVQTLLHFGLWPMVRQRPYGTIAQPAQKPKAIFVCCTDTAPLAPEISYLLEGKMDLFFKGLSTIAKLTEGTLYLTVKTGTKLFDLFTNDATTGKQIAAIPNCKWVPFSGPHPSGNVGTQIHFLAPIQKGDIVWTIDPQNVATIGNLFLNQKLDFTKRIALAGGGLKNGSYFDIVNGASVSGIIKDQLVQDDVRVISGNVLTGSNIGKEGYVGFYDHLISVIPESEERELFGWIMPNFNKFSVSRTFFSYLMPHKKYNMDTRLFGGKRVPMFSDVYSKVFPMDLLPDQLLKACYIKDIEAMEALGIYEVIEEDFALCEFVCPSKSDCQQIVKDALFELNK